MKVEIQSYSHTYLVRNVYIRPEKTFTSLAMIIRTIVSNFMVSILKLNKVCIYEASTWFVPISIMTSLPFAVYLRKVTDTTRCSSCVQSYISFNFKVSSYIKPILKLYLLCGMFSARLRWFSGERGGGYL